MMTKILLPSQCEQAFILERKQNTEGIYSTIHKAASLMVPGRSMTLPGTIPENLISREWGWQCSGGSKGGMRDACPPGGPNSFNFMHFWGNLAKSYVGAPRGLAPTPRGNSGSATAAGTVSEVIPTVGRTLDDGFVNSVVDST